ncbi:MAG: type II toxin-antitoxin system RelE/ParE family toxin [Alphaproteobacteria bacterium]|nr:type II toxin-antitoxin system RelE/ParE family toxin [Alphaproteobacteria bacterium]
MEVEFKDPDLDKLEVDASFTAGFSEAIVKAYRKAMAHIRAAADERTFYQRKSFHYEKLVGDREGQHSMMLNKQWRLILELHGAAPRKTVYVVEITDYH